ncbi:pyridoxal phosphate homeostasis protein-like [Actinia tenebrosa]|uniref:Pyridoxal phosphate homeostasis protein n=1 Tax=Actinia tenebrosa TaxID=6105 RepID=A0A6P8ICY2_ACTTE|nr:pyridoxal phosphate homeostasis protein-like [Actinia tenebrosa]
MRKIMALENVGPALRGVLARINEAVEKRPENLPKVVPRLVAVSKTKPVEYILEAYEHGQRNFGENYVQELAKKASDPRLHQLSDLKWHFIGHLQRNKCNNLTAIPNLFMVETINSTQLATALNKSWGRTDNKEPLKVMVEVNTSNEKSKMGCGSDDCCSIVNFIIQNCPNLKFIGLMTIGQYNYDWGKHGPNPDFMCLMRCQENVCEKLNMPQDQVELSMGMSSDFDKAILMGSTNVRVGSTIFGERDPTTKKGSTESEEKTAANKDNKSEPEKDEKPELSSNLKKLALA